MSEYVRVDCVVFCPKCKHKMNMKKLLSPDIFWLDCEYVSDIVIDSLSMCNGMFEPKEERE